MITTRYTFAAGASIYPFVWSLLLAARTEGLGGVMTTMPVRREADVKALFDIPDTCAVATLVVLGKPTSRGGSLRLEPGDFAPGRTRHEGPPHRV